MSVFTEVCKKKIFLCIGVGCTYARVRDKWTDPWGQKTRILSDFDITPHRTPFQTDQARSVNGFKKNEKNYLGKNLSKTEHCSG